MLDVGTIFCAFEMIPSILKIVNELSEEKVKYLKRIQTRVVPEQSLAVPLVQYTHPWITMDLSHKYLDKGRLS